MTPPPINIDGTNENYSNVTIDGQDVEQITIDGQDVLSAIPDSGISRWTFDDTDTSSGQALDVWGDNDGTINGATTGVAGQLGEAYDFDGSNDNVNLGPISQAQGVSELSISVWVNADVLGAGNGAEIYFGVQPSFANQFYVGNRTDNQFELRVEDGGTKVTVRTGTPTNDVWKHIVGTFNSGSATIYIDGGSGANGSDSNATGGPSKTLSEGADWYTGYSVTGGKNIDGTIDDPRMFSKELSQTEVENLYNTGYING